MLINFSAFRNTFSAYLIAGIDTTVSNAYSVGDLSLTRAYIKGAPVAKNLRTADLTN